MVATTDGLIGVHCIRTPLASRRFDAVVIIREARVIFDRRGSYLTTGRLVALFPVVLTAVSLAVGLDRIFISGADGGRTPNGSLGVMTGLSRHAVSTRLSLASAPGIKPMSETASGGNAGGNGGSASGGETSSSGSTSGSSSISTTGSRATSRSAPTGHRGARGSVSGSTYYVSPSGSDSNPGTKRAPWRTVGRVNRAALGPGDTVRFRGRAVFLDAALMPGVSGTTSAPITFGSYGTGRAVIANPNGAVWIPAREHDLVFTGLDLSSSASEVFASSGSGAGVSHVTLQNSVVHDSPDAGLVNQAQDSSWDVEGNTFRHLGDSGLIVMAAQMTINANTITDTGWNTSLTHGKHGIYAKGPDMTISNNDISNQTGGSAISLRYHGARVFGNLIHDTNYAVSFFPQDPSNTGQNVIGYNRMWNITQFAFYYAGTTDANQPTGIDAIFTSNTVQLANAPEAINVSEITAAHVWVTNNVFTGTYGSAYRGCASCAEYNNDWYGGSTNIPSGTGDIHVSPALSAAPALAPAATSPTINAGTTNTPGLVYTAACNTKPFDYCGSAPDLGAVE